MVIGLDYDDTYTRDPVAWNAFIRLMRNYEHKVYIVTWRTPGEIVEVVHALASFFVQVDGIYPTSRQAKAKFMFDQGICVDVWIDDNPRAILHTMEGW